MTDTNSQAPVLYVTFSNTTQAMTMEAQCTRYGLSGELVPVPRDIKASCGLAWKTTPEQKTSLTRMMQQEQIRWEKLVSRP